jgi:hypothetical protein
LPKTHPKYATWKKKAEEHNATHPAFKINFETKWAEAVEVRDFVRALTEQGKRAVATASAPRAQGPLVALPPKTPSSPVISPSVPAPAQSREEKKPQVPTREEELRRTLFRGPALPTGATNTPTVVDPLDGLTPNVRLWAQGILNWNQNTGMAGVGPVAMASAEQEALTNWVLSRKTPGGTQKFAVIIGAGSGAYTGTTQYKVVGHHHRNNGTAFTYHITLGTNSYRPTDLPAFFGF